MTNKNKIINQAQKFIQKGQWDKAIKELQKLVAEDPNDVRTLLKLGDVYAKKGEREQATKVYKQVAESYSEQGFFLKAVAVYKQILKHDPKHLEVTLKLAELYEHLGLTSEAMAQYQVASQIHDESGHSKDALDVLKRMVELDADNVASRIKLAEGYSRESRTAEAIEEFQRAADILKRQGRIDDYIKVAERLVYHDPNRIEVIKELAHIYLKKNDTKRGLAKLQLCFKAEPRDIETLTLLAGAFRDLGQTQKTIFVYRELARIHQENRNDLEARGVLQKILEIDPADAEARALLGIRTPATPQPAGFAAPGGSGPMAQPYGGVPGGTPIAQGYPLSPPTPQPHAAFGGPTGQGAAQYGAPLAGGPFGSATGQGLAQSYGGPTPGNAQVFGAATGQQAYPQPMAPQHAPMARAPSLAPRPTMPPQGYQPAPVMTPQPHTPQQGSGFAAPRAPSLAPRPAYGREPQISADLARAAEAAARFAEPPRRAEPPPEEPPELVSEFRDVQSDEVLYLDAVREAERATAARASAISAARPARPAPRADSVAVGKILTETDVYIKYGLRDKALEHLRKIFELDPDNVLAYAKMRDIYLAAGDTARAAETVANIVHIHAKSGDAASEEQARAELAQLAPGHPLIAGAASGQEWSFRPPVDEEEIDSIDITEDSDVYDAEELRSELSGGDQDPLGAWLEGDPREAVEGDGATTYDPSSFAEGEEPQTFGLLDADDAVAAVRRGPDARYSQYPAFDGGPGGMFEESSSVAVGDADILDAEAIEGGAERFDEDPAAATRIGQYPQFEDGAFDVERTDVGAAIPTVTGQQRVVDLRDLESMPADTSDLEAALAEAVRAAGEDDLDEASSSQVVSLDEIGGSTDAYRAISDDGEGFVAGGLEAAMSEAESLASADALEEEGDEGEPPVEDDLDEVEFLVTQDLLEEARELLDDVLERYPEHPRALELRARFEADVAGAQAEPELETAEHASDAHDEEPAHFDAPLGASAEPELPDLSGEALDASAEPELPDLSAEALDASPEAAEGEPHEGEGEHEAAGELEAEAHGALGDELHLEAPIEAEAELAEPEAYAADDAAAHAAEDEETPVPAPRGDTRVNGEAHPAAAEASEPEAPADEGEVSDDEVGQAFEAATGEGDEENPEDHYDHGIAYKELGRLDDAIQHFLIAARAPSREIPALEMIGHCLVAKGDFENAIQYFWTALERGPEPGAATNLKYEIAATYDAAGDAAQAAAWFQACWVDDPEHRDVRDRLAALGVDPEAEREALASTSGYGAAEEDVQKSSKKNKISYI